MLVGLGYFLVLTTYVFCQGPEWFFDMGDGYELHRWPGTLYYWKYRETGVEVPFKYTEKPFGEKVVAFRIENPWLIGKTEKGWFAVQKLKHQTHYPLVSEQEVMRITGLKIKASDLITDPTVYSFIFLPSQYELVRSWTPRVVAVVAILYLATIFLLGIDRIKKLFGQLSKCRIKPSAPP